MIYSSKLITHSTSQQLMTSTFFSLWVEVSHRVVKCSSNFAPNSFIFFVPQMSMTRCLFRAPSHWPMKMKFGKMIERRYTSWLLEVASGSVFQNSKKSRFLWFSLPSTLKTFFATQLNRIRRFFPIYSNNLIEGFLFVKWRGFDEKAFFER